MYCECGCGEKTKLAPFNRPSRGWIKGQPQRFVARHGARALKKPDYAVNPDTGCWEWQKHISKWGYGLMGGGSVGTVRPYKYRAAHREYFFRSKGEVPEGCDIHHTCGNKACVNAEHMEALPRAAHNAIHHTGNKYAVGRRRSKHQERPEL